MKVKIKKLNEAAKTPVYSTDGAACFDLHSTGKLIIGPGRSGVTGTGLSFEIPAGFVMLIFSRSGHGFKNGVRLSNCVGVIDSDYRGEVKVKLHNDDQHETFTAEAGERVAQGIILPFLQMQFVETDDLSETKRGEAGFGSTGK